MDYKDRKFEILKDKKELILSLYSSGKSVRAISEQLQISKSSIGDFIRVSGVSRTDFKGSKNPFYGKTHSEEFKQEQSARMKGTRALNKGKSKYGKTKYFSGMLLHRWSRSATVRQLTYTISNDFLDALWEKQQGLCALTGLEMMTSYPGDKFTTVSLDRIDSDGLYTEDNVQFVLGIVNIMKNSLSENQFKFYCQKVASHVDG